MSSSIVTYILRNLADGYQMSDIITALEERGWSKAEIDQGIAEYRANKPIKPIPIAPRPGDINLEIKNLNPAQILLFIGGLITFLGAIIFIGINWESWGSLVRILVISVPTFALLGWGATIWIKEQKNIALIFLVVGSLLIPLATTIILQELGFDTKNAANAGLIVSATALISYISMRYIFPAGIWVLLYCGAGIFAWYFFLRTIGLPEKDYLPYQWLYIPLGILYAYIAMVYEKFKKPDYAQFAYFFSAVILIIAPIAIAFNGGGLIRWLLIDAKDNFAIPFITVGLVFFMVSFTIDKFKDTWVKGFSGYSQIFNFLATFLILASILYQSLGGKKVDWETALLFTSLGFIFLSTAKASRSYLYLGTMFLIVYIFDIGGEYFSDNVGWPITLLIAGVLSMGVGFVFEQLRKRYLPKQ
jgi:uncharacterized membrane protein